MSIYCLRKKRTLRFSCVSKTEEELDAKIKDAYLSWYGIQPKGSNTTMGKFMETREKVKLDISIL